MTAPWTPEREAECLEYADTDPMLADALAALAAERARADAAERRLEAVRAYATALDQDATYALERVAVERVADRLRALLDGAP